MISAPVYNSNRKQAPWSLYERLIAPTSALRQCDVLQQRTLAVSSSPRLRRWRQHQPVVRKHANVNTSYGRATYMWWTRVLCLVDWLQYEPVAADARRRCDPSQRPHATRTASHSRRCWRSGRSPQLKQQQQSWITDLWRYVTKMALVSRVGIVEIKYYDQTHCRRVLLHYCVIIMALLHGF